MLYKVPVEKNMRVQFEQQFKHLLAEIPRGKVHVIDLCEKHLTTKHVYALADALNANFHATSRITEIDLSFAGIVELPINMFRDCDSLRRLNLEFNKLKQLPHLPDRPYALQEFYAGSNPLKHMK